MTREEAIKIIDCYDIGFYDLSGEKIPADKLVDAFDMAIEALSEQKTGEWTKKTLLKDTVYDLHVYKCSCCGVLGKLKFNYCPNCGARMYKGGEEE